jgi:hypothetical protein
MQKWLFPKGRRSHLARASNFASRILPSRLLDVSSTNTIRLVEVKTLRDACYLALSHCWGESKQQYETTGATLSDRFAGFQLNSLSRSYRDAVTITQNLGFDYLWIDSLCIVQDDVNEWHTESSNMGDIFKNAFCTLFAHCSRGDNEGFLLSALRSRALIYLGQRSSQKFLACPIANLDADVTHSNLCSRGWVLQERFLSTRILHFTPGMLYFETAEGVEAEDGTIWRPHSTGDEELSAKVGKRKSRYFGPSSVPNLVNFFHGISRAAPSATPLEWYLLVEMYSGCKLSREYDKLIAISGMANQIHKHSGVPYYAGIWGDSIAAGLLWLPEGQILVRPKQERAPCWSWASFDGPIQYPLDILAPAFTPLCKAISANRQDTGADTTWLQGSGCLVIEARTYDLSLSGVEIREAVELGPDHHSDALQSEMSCPNVHTEVRAHRLEWNNLSVGWIIFDEDMCSDQPPVMGQSCCKAYDKLVCIAVATDGAPSFSSISQSCYALFVVPARSGTLLRPDSGVGFRSSFEEESHLHERLLPSSKPLRQQPVYRRIGMGLLRSTYRAQNPGKYQTVHLC